MMQNTPKKTPKNIKQTGSKGGIFEKLGDKQRYIIYASVAVILFAVAILSIISSSNAESLSSCATKALPGAKLSCYVYYANSMHNESICGYLNGSPENICMDDYSYNYTSAFACTKISSYQYKESCILGISLETNNLTSCTLLNQSGQSGCIYSIIKNENFTNVNLCNLIKNYSSKQACIALHYYRDAMVYGNISACAHLTGGLNNTTLYTITSSDYGPLQAGFFSGTMTNITPQDYCYMELANETNNRSICNSLNGSVRIRCNNITSNVGSINNLSSNLTTQMNTILGYGNNASELTYIRNITNISLSIGNALTERNVTECIKINQPAFVYTCVLDLAERYNQSSYCAYLTNSTMSYNCYLTLNNTD